MVVCFRLYVIVGGSAIYINFDGTKLIATLLQVSYDFWILFHK